MGEGQAGGSAVSGSKRAAGTSVRRSGEWFRGWVEDWKVWSVRWIGTFAMGKGDGKRGSGGCVHGLVGLFQDGCIGAAVFDEMTSTNITTNTDNTTTTTIMMTRRQTMMMTAIGT
eukprot:120875-Rhodomonas_salina.1